MNSYPTDVLLNDKLRDAFTEFLQVKHKMHNK